MEVHEVIRLSDWFAEYVEDAAAKFDELVRVLQHNAQQANKLEVQEPLESLCDTLQGMPTEQISSLQMRLLGDLQVDTLIGKRGAQWVESTVKTTTYDPATTFTTIQTATQKIREALAQLAGFKKAAKSVGITREPIDATENQYLINVIFQHDAAIANVRDWKKMAGDWEQIISGLAAAAGEKPEDVAVVGVSNGSIILTLGATAAVTKLLAMISKHITGIAHDVLSVRIKAEELRQARFMTKTMEAEFQQLETAKRDEGKQKIAEAIEDALPDLKPEVRAKIDKSVDKALAFGEAGGEVDFVVPDDDLSDNEVNEELQEIIALVEDQQTARDGVKLLENRSSN